METFTKEQVVRTVARMCDIIIENEVPFCELDSVAGDGDFGMSLAKGFKVVKAEWANHSQEDIGAFLKDCGMIITEHCGGASGPIWGSGFRAMGRYAQGKDTLYKHALEGFTGNKGMMPARGGAATLGDDEVKAAVDFMADQSI